MKLRSHTLNFAGAAILDLIAAANSKGHIFFKNFFLLLYYTSRGCPSVETFRHLSVRTYLSVCPNPLRCLLSKHYL